MEDALKSITAIYDNLVKIWNENPKHDIPQINFLDVLS